MTITEQVPDSIKVGVSVSSSALMILGISPQEWMYILSALVSIMFIIEKLPITITRIRSFVRWVKHVYQSSK